MKEINLVLEEMQKMMPDGKLRKTTDLEIGEIIQALSIRNSLHHTFNFSIFDESRQLYYQVNWNAGLIKIVSILTKDLVDHESGPYFVKKIKK